eukprot:Phypoly_transcript_05786.p1 GENE.Phypoly_transcript_05786~~Phypoly_transcript_05786.p1  ORF type:complete len:554 (+),score=80.11 Phypoly_transcript_05786:209-1870(+)
MLCTPRRSFKTFFCENDGGALLKSAATSGSLQTTGIRSIAWIYFLGDFPKGTPDELDCAIASNRVEYQQLVVFHISDPRASQESDPTINNPLSQAEDSPWAKFFQNAELEKTIHQDIERCYPDKEFFQEPFVRDIMSRILFIYAKMNPSLSYRQGMHELLAPIVYLLHNERSKKENELDPEDAQTKLDESAEKVLASLLDITALEADVFFIFRHLMCITGDWFSPVPPSNQPKKVNSGTTGAEDEQAATPVVNKCRRIQHLLLKNKDPELHDHLLALKIEPQFYLLRWVRLLLGREFHSLDDLMIIWDAIFAHSPDLVLVDYICVSMLVFIREQLLERDSTGCLTRLMKYPPVEDVRIFIEQAHTLISNRMQKPPSYQSPPLPLSHSPQTASSPSSNSSPTAPTASTSPSSSTHASSLFKPKLPAKPKGLQGKPLQTISPASSVKHNLDIEASNTTNVAVLQAQLRTQQHTQLIVAQRIDTIVHSLQQALTASNLQGDLDPLLLSIAELKQTKDILCGFLPATDDKLVSPEEDTPELDAPDHPLSDPLSRQLS